MPESSTVHPHLVDNPHNKDIQFGVGVSLRPVEEIYHALKESGLTRHGLAALLRALHIPTVEIGKKKYINPFYLMLAIHAISRPGNKNFLAPGCDSIRRGVRAEQSGGLTREYDLSEDLDQIHIFIAEIVAVRRGKLIRDHEKFVQNTSDIVNRIAQTYDALDAPLAYERFTKQSVKDSRAHIQGSIPTGLGIPNPVPSSP